MEGNISDNIKMTLFVILTGKAEGERLINYLAFLADKCGIAGENDFLEPSEISSTGIFIEDSLDFLEKDMYDEWIEYFKQKLLKEEKYELVVELAL